MSSLWAYYSSGKLRPTRLPGFRATRLAADYTIEIVVVEIYVSTGAQGVTLTFSSGDGGVGDGVPNPATTECITNDGTNRVQFIPAFPASCPLCVQQ